MGREAQAASTSETGVDTGPYTMERFLRVVAETVLEELDRRERARDGVSVATGDKPGEGRA